MYNVVLIPSFEPDEKLLRLVIELYNSDFRIVVVNDGSSLEYNKIFDECKKYAKVLTYSENRGKGYALKTGLKYIHDNYDKCNIVTMDSDGQHTVKDAKKVISKVSSNQIVLGKRLRNKNTPLKSKIGNKITSIFYYLSTGIHIYDTQTGLRAFNSKLIGFLLNIEGNRYEYEMNMLLEAPKINIKLEEVLIETIYENNNKGTHFNPIKDSLLIYKNTIKFGLSSISSFILDYLLYIILLLISNNLLLSNILSRIVSCNYNYFINKKYVFNNNDKIYNSIFKYYILVIFILIINSLLLNVFVNILFINKYIAKIIIELLLFIVNYFIERRFIFVKR